MIKENVLEIKKLVSDLHCMGTYGMVELELTKIENYVKELEGKVKNLTIPVVPNRTCSFCGGTNFETIESQYNDIDNDYDRCEITYCTKCRSTHSIDV